MKRHIRPFKNPPPPRPEPWRHLPKESRYLVKYGVDAWRAWARAFRDYYDGRISQEEYAKADARLKEIAKEIANHVGYETKGVIGYLSEYA